VLDNDTTATERQIQLLLGRWAQGVASATPRKPETRLLLLQNARIKHMHMQ